MNATDAKNKMGQMLDTVMQGHVVLITKNDATRAELTPCQEPIAFVRRCKVALVLDLIALRSMVGTVPHIRCSPVGGCQCRASLDSPVPLPVSFRFAVHPNSHSRKDLRRGGGVGRGRRGLSRGGRDF
jgi:antitoxin (DNA-binding transcriptional repressor) of toxin-antitoxin stability system